MIRLLPGDCRSVLATLPADSVHTVVTSPPYYGLRDYGTALWDGGDAACDHTAKQPKRGNAEYTNGQGGSFSSNLQAWGDRDVSTVYRDVCGKCGAVRIDRQIGLEASPDEYLATMVAVFREVRRVLRPDGTCWVNMGDSYNASAGGATPRGLEVGRISAGAHPVYQKGDGRGKTITAKPKDLLLMPARLALALQADGWWVRSDIIWHKPNPMPESCTDRPTSAHEHVFLLTRSARYFYDADAVRSPLADKTFTTFGTKHRPQGNDAGGNVKSDNWGSSLDERKPKLNGAGELAGAALRNVWTIATAPYSEAHFATFPPALAERCIRAGTSERGCCAQCGKPWTRVLDVETRPNAPSLTGKYNGNGVHRTISGGVSNDARAREDRGWQPGCAHGAAVVPCTVLDPFAGAGTTLLVADRLQRDAIGVELNVAYTQMAMDRVRADAPLLVDAPAAEPPEDARMADLFDMAAD